MAIKSTHYVGKRFIIEESLTGTFYVNEYINDTDCLEHGETWQVLANAKAYCHALMGHTHVINGETVECKDLDYCAYPVER